MSLQFSIKTRPDGIDETERKMRVLLVEDHAQQRDILKALLERRIAERVTLVKVEIVTAATLAAGLEIAETANCTVVDLTLPDSDSENTIRSIRKFRPPVIVTTGDDDPATETACIEAGAEAVYVKGSMMPITGSDTKGERDLCRAVVQCLLKDLCRLNGLLAPHGNDPR